MKFICSKGFEDGERIIWDAFKATFEHKESKYSVAYHGLPVLEKIGRGDKEPDIAILCETLGLLVIEIKDAKIEQIESIDGPAWYMSESWYIGRAKGRHEQEFPITQARQQMFCILDQLKQGGCGELIDDRGFCLIAGNYLVALPFITRMDFENKFGNTLSDKLLFSDSLGRPAIQSIKARLDFQQTTIPDKLFEQARMLISGSSFLARPISKPISNSNTKMYFLRESRRKMTSLLSFQQEQAGNHIPDGPQRIRGLAGTGKTIVMAMKIARIIQLNPEWKVLVTCSTKSLTGTLVRKVADFIGASSIPDGERGFIHLPANLEIVHADRALESLRGVLGIVAEFPYGKTDFQYRLAERSNLLLKRIHELVAERSWVPPYNAVVIDESQDLPDAFMRLGLSIAKEGRLIWGVDEMQQLSDLEVKSTRDMFGIDASGNDIVDLSGTYAGDIPKDLLLNIVYRTPRQIVVAAFAFGMGLLRTKGALQFIDRVSFWEEMGYSITGNSSDRLLEGEHITLERKWDFSPHNLEHMIPFQDIVRLQCFESSDDEYDWVCNQVMHDIENELIEPSDILIQYLSNRQQPRFVESMIQRFSRLHVSSFDHRRSDNFNEKGMVTIQTLRKSKGNEAGNVYVMGVEHADGDYDNYELTQRRNFAFTAMTRSNGYLTITGSGPSAQGVINELSAICQNNSRVSFTVPNVSTIRNLFTQEYERNLEKERERNDAFRNLAETLRRQGVDLELIRKLNDLQQGVERRSREI
jgi:superfamily I DNA and RNA helicase